MSTITLKPEIVSSNEACISWVISVSSSISNISKATLFLSDINQTSPNNSFSIVKYQIRKNEYANGSHTFTNLQTGKYIAKIIIFYDINMIESNPIEIEVFNLAVPEFEINGIIPSSQQFNVYLKPLLNNDDMINGTVTFILFGQYISEGVTEESSAGAINMIFPYNSNNEYLLDDSRIQNDVEYELSCFYTNQFNCSSELSESKIVRPTNLPSQVTNLTAEYDSVNQTLKIFYDVPNNVAGYVPLNCLATITDNTDPLNPIITYYNSNVNPAGLSPAPTPLDTIVFNMNNENLLPIDNVFTITIAISNEYGYGYQSDPIYCVHPKDYCSKAVLNENLTFSLTEDNGLQIINSDTPYIENTNYTVKYVSEVFECLVDGSVDETKAPIVVIPDQSYPNGIYNLPTLQKGTVYKYILNVYYEKPIDTSVINFQPNVVNTCYFYFIPHLAPLPLTLSSVPNDTEFTISWGDLTLEELNGYNLHHYEYYMGDLPTDFATNSSIVWTSVDQDIAHTFDLLTNGTSYTVNVRAVTYSNNTLYGNNDRLVSTPSTIIATPFKNPKAPIFVSKLPEDGKSTFVFTLADIEPFNGGDLDQFEASIDSNNDIDGFSKIEPDYDNVTKNYTKVFDLSNDIQHTIRFRVVTQNKSDSTVKRYSDVLMKQTTPYAKPVLPTSFRAIPRETTVELSWIASNPNVIIGNSVKYEVSYKLSTDNEYTLVSANPIAATTHTVSGLTSNLSYDFRIRSQILNDELNVITYSTSYSSVTSRPFKYFNSPKMELVTGIGASRIDVKLSPATGNEDPDLNNYYNDKFNYYATIYEKTDTTKARPKTTSALNIETTNIQTLTLNTFNDGDADVPNVDPALVDFSLYVIECYYEMFNPETETYYTSDVVSNQAFPYENDNGPILTIADTVVGVKSVTLSWTIPKLSGLNIVGYEIKNRLEDTNPWREIPNSSITEDADVFTTVVTDYLDFDTISPIEPGRQYYFSIRAKILETSGQYLYSTKSNTVVANPYNSPGKPINLVATAIGDGKLKVDWAEGDLGFLGLWSYQIKIGSNAYIPSNESVISSGSRSTTYTFNGLTNGQTYTVSIRMITINTYENNKLITGDVETISAIVYDKAKAPTNFVAYSNIDLPNTVRLSWNAVTGDDLGGLVLDHYEVNDNGASSVPLNVGLNLSYNFENVTTIRSGSSFRLPGGDRSADYISKATPVRFTVKAITRKADNSAINGTINTSIAGDMSTRLNIAVSKPDKPTRVSVVRSYFADGAGYPINFPATDGILYMLIEVDYAYGSSSDIMNENNGLFQSKHYAYGYQVSTDGITWITPSSRTQETSLPINTGINEYTLNAYGMEKSYGLHTWGGPATNNQRKLLRGVDNRFQDNDFEIIDFTFTPNGSINLGQEYRFFVRKVTYNLFNTVTNLDNWPVIVISQPDISTAIFSDPSEVVVNTSYHVTPQQNYYDNLSIVYYANPLLNVTSTPSNGKINLTWDAANSSVLGGLTLNYYEVRLNTGSWTTVNNDTSITNYEFTGLTNGQEYTVSVRTNCTHSEINISGTTITNVFTGTPVSVYNVPYVKASAPANLVKSYPDSQQVKIVWDAVTGVNLGGLSLKNYQVSSDGITWTDVASSIREYTFTGLTNGTQYTINVRAITNYIDATSSSVVLSDLSTIEGTSGTISVIPRATPVAPTFVSCAQDDTKLDLTWDYNTSAPGLISFNTFNGAVGSASLIDSITAESLAYDNLGSNKYKFSFTGLTNGIKYSLKIVPVLIISSTSELIVGNALTTRSFVPYVKASVPTSLITTPGDKQIKLEWSPVANLGGLSLQKYQVSVDGTTWTNVASDLQEYTFTELDNGTSYNMSVRAITEFIDADMEPLVNFQDIEGTSATISAIPFVKPDTVSNISTSVINNLFTFTFTAPTDVNNNKFTQYYEYSINNGDSWALVDLNGPWPIVTVGNDVFSSKFRVYIVNPNNASINVYGDIITVSDLQNIVVTTPENLKATVGNGFVTLSWKHVTNMSYQVIRYASPNNITAIITSSTYTFSELTNGTEYNFGVAIYTSGSAGPVANISATPMSAPIIGTVSLSGGILSINVNYGGSSNANIILTCYKASLITSTDPDTNETYTEVAYTNPLNFNNNITSTLVTFSVNTPASPGVRAVARNYFDIIITNSVGSTSRIYTTLNY